MYLNLRKKKNKKTTLEMTSVGWYVGITFLTQNCHKRFKWSKNNDLEVIINDLPY